MAKFGFDVAEVDVNAPIAGGSREPIPEGNYVLKAIEAESKTTAKGGEMIVVKYEVVEGEYKGRWIWNNFNVVCASEKAQSIARQQLVAWATACGKPDADDTDKLIDRQFTATVVINPGDEKYKPSNEISAFLFTTEEKKPAAKPAARTVPTEKPAAKAANPWD